MSRLFAGAIVSVLLGLPVTLLAETFMIPVNLQGYSAPFPPGVLEKIESAQLQADMKNMGTIGGLIGAIGCAVMGGAAAANAGRGTGKAFVLGGVLGLLLGAAGGAASALTFRGLLLNPMDPFIKGVLTQVSLTGGIGIALSLTLCFAVRPLISMQAAITVVVCSVIAAVGYPFAAAFLFPLNRSDIALPEGMGNRALWLAIPFVLYALTIGRSKGAAVVAEATSDVPAGSPA